MSELTTNDDFQVVRVDRDGDHLWRHRLCNLYTVDPDRHLERFCPESDGR